MIVYCKRTFFEKNLNNEECVKWFKDKYYNVRKPKDYESKVGVFYIIESERESFWYPITEKEFHKYFIDIDELRNEKIDRILNI
jgi:ABC-type Na+ transport system ATPase subunit NatA